MRQPSFLRPRPLTCPATSPKLFFSSSTLLLSVTLSVPALSSGLFTSGHHTFPWLSSRLGSRRPFSSRKASTSLQSVALTWATARRPAWRMVSPMRYLFRRARLSERLAKGVRQLHGSLGAWQDGHDLAPGVLPVELAERVLAHGLDRRRLLGLRDDGSEADLQARGDEALKEGHVTELSAVHAHAVEARVAHILRDHGSRGERIHDDDAAVVAGKGRLRARNARVLEQVELPRLLKLVDEGVVRLQLFLRRRDELDGPRPTEAVDGRHDDVSRLAEELDVDVAGQRLDLVHRGRVEALEHATLEADQELENPMLAPELLLRHARHLRPGARVLGVHVHRQLGLVVAPDLVGDGDPEALTSVAPGTDLDQARARRRHLHLRVGRSVSDAERVEHPVGVVDQHLAEARSVRGRITRIRDVAGEQLLPEVHEGAPVRRPPIVLPDGDALVLAVQGDRVHDVLNAGEILLHEDAVVHEAKLVSLPHDAPVGFLHLVLRVAQKDVVGARRVHRLHDHAVLDGALLDEALEEAGHLGPRAGVGLLNRSQPGGAHLLPHQVLVAARRAELRAIARRQLHGLAERIRQLHARLRAGEDRPDLGAFRGGEQRGHQIRQLRLQLLRLVHLQRRDVLEHVAVLVRHHVGKLFELAAEDVHQLEALIQGLRGHDDAGAEGVHDDHGVRRLGAGLQRFARLPPRELHEAGDALERRNALDRSEVKVASVQHLVRRIVHEALVAQVVPMAGLPQELRVHHVAPGPAEAGQLAKGRRGARRRRLLVAEGLRFGQRAEAVVAGATDDVAAILLLLSLFDGEFGRTGRAEAGAHCAPTWLLLSSSATIFPSRAAATAAAERHNAASSAQPRSSGPHQARSAHCATGRRDADALRAVLAKSDREGKPRESRERRSTPKTSGLRAHCGSAGRSRV
eukprot:scaffold529_cov308-Pinguiococcus_pyrenoidosus.AAC.2